MSVFNPSPELITRDWLESVADRMDCYASGYDWAVFEVEIDTDDGGYTLLRVEANNSDLNAIEIITNTGDDGAEDQGTGIGLFRYRDDVLALLEILARGVHGWPV